MINACVNNSFAQFLDSPKFLFSTAHTITLIGIPIHIFAGFCILSKTPSQMNSMKWPMLNLHLWSVFLDISIGFLMVPFIYLPVLGGYSLGFLNDLGVAVKDMYYMCVVQIAGVIVSVAILFETRFFILYARYTIWRHLRVPWMILNFLVAFTYMIPTYLAIPDQKTGKSYQFGRYPCLPAEVYDEKVFLLTTWSTGAAYNMSLNTAAQQTIIFVILIYWNMRKSLTLVKLSKKTIQMHRTFIKTLILQVTIPLIIVIGPLTLNIFTTYNSYYNQGANNLSVCFMATHGLVSSLAMIYLHKSYWVVVSEVICPKWSNQVEQTQVFTVVAQRTI